MITRYPNGLPGLIPADYFDESEAEGSLQAADAVLLHVDQTLAKAPSSGKHQVVNNPQDSDMEG